MQPRILKILENKKTIEKERAAIDAASPLLGKNREPLKESEPSCAYKILILLSFFWCASKHKKTGKTPPICTQLSLKPS
jgi:hypothetical protein